MKTCQLILFVGIWSTPVLTTVAVPASEAVIPDILHDAGVVFPSQRLRFMIPIFNQGVNGMEILECRPSCSCILLSQHPESIAPGGVWNCEMEFESPNINNQIYRYVDFTLVSGGVPRTERHTIKVVSKDLLEFPGDGYNFESVSPGQLSERAVHIRRGGYPKSFDHVDFKVHGGNGLVKVSLAQVNQNEWEAKFQVTPAAESSGHLGARVEFTCSDGPLQLDRIIPVIITADIPSPVSVEPRMVFFGVVTSKEERSDEISLLESNGDALITAHEIVKAESSDPKRLRLDVSDPSKVKIDFQAIPPSGSVNGNISLWLRNGHCIQVPYLATVGAQ